ncbi:DUF1700 domain-containing protein [Paenibacillus sp. YPG26]|uniref:HAAS signaling domain-containing protein n=1 Tax=Paenibacillus sp. YPG26 TaxID=2878915 RepID=UPI00204090D5|nr:DUF1700 domain-containing protein [Paenibacillus sp. YPG26]USB32949.1 DUF1700 domain-containing protein [Paenibacillus sp. YPG26]
MTKHEFLTQLSVQLSQLPPEERLELLEDYEAHFAFGKQNGKSEEEIVSELGDPHELAKEALGERFISQEPVYWYHDPNKKQSQQHTAAPAQRPGRGITAQVFVLIGMFFMNIVLAPLMIAFWAVVISIMAAALAGILSPALLVMDMIFYTVSPAKWFASIFMVGLGILLGIGSKGLLKGVLFTTRKYLSWNYHLAKGDA